VIRRYEDRLAYWVSERDGGQADALNKGFARCTGDIVAWINSDDYYYPGAFAAAALAFRADPDLGFAYGRGNRVAEDGTVVREFEYTRPFDADALVYGVDYILQPTVFMRRSALHAVGPFDPDLHYAFDWDLWIRLARRFPVGRLEVSRIVAAGREHDSAKTFIGGFPRCEEIRRIVGRHTGEELTVGSLAYYLMSLVQTLPGADVPDSGELRSAAMALLGEVHELLMSNRVRRGTTARRLESLPDRDGWVGRELRVRRAVPEESRWLCVRGIHVREVWEAAGPLVLRADLDGEPLGIGVVFVPGAFTISWPLPPGRPPGPHEREIVMRASSVSAATLCHPEDPRFLSFQLAELHFEAALPTGSLCAHAEPGGVGRAVARAYRREHASVEPYGDGWAGPELRLVRPWPRAARLLALSGAHDPAIVSVEETLVLWATVDGQPLGRGVVRAPGPFTLCWPLPVGGRSAPSPDVAEGHCEVTIRSATSVVPARFWPSDDYRELTFRFRALELLPTPPRGALTSSGP